MCFVCLIHSEEKSSKAKGEDGQSELNDWGIIAVWATIVAWGLSSQVWVDFWSTIQKIWKIVVVVVGVQWAGPLFLLLLSWVLVPGVHAAPWLVISLAVCFLSLWTIPWCLVCDIGVILGGIWNICSIGGVHYYCGVWWWWWGSSTCFAWWRRGGLLS